MNGERDEQLTPAPSPSAPSPGQSGELSTRHVLDGRSRGWRIVAALSVISAVLVNLVVAWSARWPSFPYDEVATLQMSRLLAGVDPSNAVGGAGYFPGWSLLVAPLWWFTDDPLLVYRIAIFLGVAIAIATIYPLALMMRRWRLSWFQAVTAAAIIMTLPTRSLQSDYVLSEQLVFTTVVFLVLAVMRLWESPSYARALIVGLLAFATLFTHARMLPVLLALCIWLLLFVTKNWRVALVGILLVIAAMYSADYLGRWLNEILLGRPFTQGDRFFDRLEAMRLSLPARTGIGQSWAQLLSSFGLIALGAVTVIGYVWKDLRRFRFGPTVFIFGASLAMLLLSALNWADDQSLYWNEWVRLDVWIYARYLDPVSILITASGLAVVLRGAKIVQHAWALALTLVVSIPAIFWVAPNAPTFGHITPAHLPGIMPWAGLLPDHAWSFPDGPWIVPSFTNENQFWLIATLSVLACMVLLVILRRQRLVAAVLVLAVAAVSSVIANEASDRFQQFNGVVPERMLESIEVLDDELADLDIHLIRDCPSPGRDVFAFRNYLFYYALPVLIESEPSDTAPAGADAVISCVDWPQADELGAVPLPDTQRGQDVLWLISDEAVDAAEEQGLLAR